VTALAREARPLALAEALDALRAPDATERFSPLTGQRVLVIDLGGTLPQSEAEIAAAVPALASLPAPSIAITAEELAPAAAALARGCDLNVHDRAELSPVLAGIDSAPLAAAALVQLLRAGEGVSIEAGLVLESLVYSTLQAGPEFAAWREQRGAPKLRPPPKGPAVLAAREGERLHVTLARPEKRNAFSAEMRDGLVEALRVAVCDPGIREVRLDGAGPDFCSGGDLDEFGTLPDPATAHVVRTTRSPARLLAAIAPRVVAVVHGACVGAGVELPAFAGRLVARADASFWLPELSLGLVPGAGGTVSLPRRIGRQRTAWLALSGRAIDAETALVWGLIDELREPGSGD
jgi:enoyl-CoA hydratase/carnithine racemase